jgi:hypothetical protein
VARGATPRLDLQARVIHITGAGWALYEREWACYREPYSDVEAIEPGPG